MVVINLEDFWVITVKILGIKPALFFSNSICILFAETNAISIPEKNADNRIDIMIIMSSTSIKKDTYYLFWLFLFSTFFLKCLLKKNTNVIKIEKPRNK
jgi:hypothetical protein